MSRADQSHRRSRKREIRIKCPTCHGRGAFMHGDTCSARVCATCAGKGWVKR